MPHIGFEGFDMEDFATGLVNGFAELQMVIELLLDLGNLSLAVACGLEFVGNVDVCSNEGCDLFIQFNTLGFKVVREFDVAAKVVDKVEFFTEWWNGFTKVLKGFENDIEAFSAFGEAVLGIGLVALGSRSEV